MARVLTDCGPRSHTAELKDSAHILVSFEGPSELVGKRTLAEVREEKTWRITRSGEFRKCQSNHGAWHVCKVTRRPVSLETLKDIYYVEKKLVKTLPKMAKKASARIEAGY